MRTFTATKISVIFLATSTLAAGDRSESYGFHYDNETQRHFSSGKATFSVRPVADPDYLSRIEASIDEKNWEPYKGSLKFDTEGLHHIRFRAVDPVLNWTPIQTFRVYVDMSAPRSTVVWEGPSYTKDKSVFAHPESVLTIVSQDGISGVARILTRQRTPEQSSGGNATQFSGRAQYKREGSYTIEFAAIDRVGNEETWKTHEFTIDATPPKTEMIMEVAGNKGGEPARPEATKGALFVNSGTQFVLNATDSLSGVKQTEYRINNGPITLYKQPVAVNSKAIEFSYRSIDQVGNAEAWKTFSVQQDLSPPSLALQRAGFHLEHRGTVYARPGFTLSLNASDSDSGLRQILVSMDGGEFKESSERKFTFQKPGGHLFRARAIDKVGNVTEVNPVQVFIDDTAPVSKLSSTDALVENNGVFLSAIPNRIEITGEDSGAGIERLEISFDGKTFYTLDRAIDLAEWKEARRTLYYRAVDRLGNLEPVQKRTIQVKTAGPAVDLFVEAGDLPNVPLSSLKGRSAPVAVPAAPTAQETERAPSSKEEPKKAERKPNSQNKKEKSKTSKSKPQRKKK